MYFNLDKQINEYNADFEVNTLDRHSTRIPAISFPGEILADAVSRKQDVVHLEMGSATSVIGKAVNVQLDEYHKATNVGLQNVKISDITIICSPKIVLSASDIAWLCSKCLKKSLVLDWNGL